MSDELGACLGITAHRAVFADGSISGKTVLVQGMLGGVGSVAAQLALWRGAEVIGTVRRQSVLGMVDATVAQIIGLDGDDPASAIRGLAPDGVDRIVEVALSDNVDLDNHRGGPRCRDRSLREPSGSTWHQAELVRPRRFTRDRSPPSPSCPHG